MHLVRKRALDASPGLSHLRMEVADDVALGMMLKASGARCRVFAARRDVHLVCAERLGVLAKNMEKGGHAFGFSLLLALIVPFALLSIDLGVPAVALAHGGAAAAPRARPTRASLGPGRQRPPTQRAWPAAVASIPWKVKWPLPFISANDTT